jgi:acetyl esterase/lipase
MSAKPLFAQRLGWAYLALAVLIGVLVGCQPSGAVEMATSTPVPPTLTPTVVPPTATPTSESGYPTHSGVPYADDGHRRHLLDVYLPQGTAATLPTLFVLHGLREDGDGYHPVSRNARDALVRHFVEQGYAVVLADYRYPSEPWEQHMAQDAFCSLAWVHANAETYGFDPQRIVVFGDHFGAMLAAKLGTVDDPVPFLEECPHRLPESDWIKGVATYGGLFFSPEGTLTMGFHVLHFARSYQINSEIPHKEMTEVFETLRDVPPSEWQSSGELEERAKRVAGLMPLYWADGTEPPFLLIHGAKDEWVYPLHSEEFAAGLRATGAEAEVLVLPDAGHSGLASKEQSEGIYRAVETFLAELFE